MKFAKDFRQGHSILYWVRKFALILLIPALVVFFLSICLSIWETQRNKPSYSYQHPQDSIERIIQHINCPTFMFKGNGEIISANINAPNLKKESNITISIMAEGFTFAIDHERPHSVKQSSPNVSAMLLWWITPQDVGKKTVTISAVTDNGVSDTATCQIIILDFFGIYPQYLNNFVTIVFILNFLLLLPSLQEKEDQRRISKQEAATDD